MTVFTVKSPFLFTRLASSQSAIAIPAQLRMGDFTTATADLPPLCIQQLPTPVALSSPEGATAFKDLLPLLPKLFPTVPLVLTACVVVGFVIKTQELGESIQANHYRIDRKTAYLVLKWSLALPSLAAELIPQLKALKEKLEPIGVAISAVDRLYALAANPNAPAGLDNFVFTVELQDALTKYTHPAAT